MPNTPAQFPNFDLPGAEWFALAPNANIAIQGRRRVEMYLPPPYYTAVPAGGTALSTVTTRLETGFTQSAGIYIHYAYFNLIPGDNAGRLQVLHAQMGLNISEQQPYIDIPIGQPLITGAMLGTDTNVGQLASSAQQMLFTSRDFLGGWTPLAPSQVLNFIVSASFKNTDTVTHNVAPFAQIIYSRLDGFTE